MGNRTQEPLHIGRPPHPPIALRHAQRDARWQMELQGKRVGEGAVMAAIGDGVLRRLVRRALFIWRAHDQKRATNRALALHVRIVPVSPGVMASMDIA